MWTLKKPDIRTAINDIDKLMECCKVLTNEDKVSLTNLFTQYDEQNGLVTDTQLEVISESKANSILSQYKKTQYSNSSTDLVYIRSELTEDVNLCPLCSISEPTQLDHFMPKKPYLALATCRLNLVPICGKCNQKKSNRDFNKFVHSYYTSFPEIFFITNIEIIENKCIPSFSFDLDASEVNQDLKQKLENQSTIIELWERLAKESNRFICDLFISCMAEDDTSLKLWLKQILNSHNTRYGNNDWRTSIIRGLLNCNDLNVELVNNYKVKPEVISCGGA